jgi:hypothetical protein
MKHTKGEWKVDVECDGNLHIISNIEIIASINCSSFDGKIYEPTNEEKANAKLIAAAPELLDMLIKISNVENQAFSLKGFDVERLKSEINTSIKKATE